MNKPGRSYITTTLLSILFSACGMCLSSSPASALSGDGTTATPYVISTCNDLENMASNLAANYILGNNIDCSGSGAWNNGTGFTPVGLSASTPFTGSFDGQGYNITNLTESTQVHFNGLFGNTDGASIKDVNLIDPVLTVNYYSGALIGVAENTQVDNVSAQGITMTCASGCYYDGGLVGDMYNNGGITESWTSGNLTINTGVGGIAGVMDTGATLSNSYSLVDITALTDAGGLVDYSDTALSITNSYAAVTMNMQPGSSFGGIIDYAPPTASISNSFSDSTLTGTTGTNNGALVNSDITLSNDYYDTQKAGSVSQTCASTAECEAVNINNSAPAYFIGNSNNSPYTNWDFVNTWIIQTGGLPQLRASLIPQPPVINNVTTSQTAASITDTIPTPVEPSTAVNTIIVQYRVSGSTNWATSAPSNPAVSTIAITGLLPVTSYDFQIAGMNVVGTSRFSNIFTAMTLAAVVEPTVQKPTQPEQATVYYAAVYTPAPAEETISSPPPVVIAQPETTASQVPKTKPPAVIPATIQNKAGPSIISRFTTKLDGILILIFVAALSIVAYRHRRLKSRL